MNRFMSLFEYPLIEQTQLIYLYHKYIFLNFFKHIFAPPFLFIQALLRTYNRENFSQIIKGLFGYQDLLSACNINIIFLSRLHHIINHKSTCS